MSMRTNTLTVSPGSIVTTLVGIEVVPGVLGVLGEGVEVEGVVLVEVAELGRLEQRVAAVAAVSPMVGQYMLGMEPKGAY